MGRYSGGGSKHHSIKYIPRYGGYYEISWVVDRYYRGSRLRFPTQYTRQTDEKGARRFCKKWGLELPENLR